MHQNMHQEISRFFIYEDFSYKSFILLVPGGGVEPPRGCPRRILSPLRLPVPPSRPILPHTKRAQRHRPFNSGRSCFNFV